MGACNGAAALILILQLRRQVPEAHGRYLTSHSSTISTKTLSDILSKRFPQYKFPEGKDQPAKEVIDNSKVGRHLICTQTVLSLLSQALASTTGTLCMTLTTVILDLTRSSVSHACG